MPWSSLTVHQRLASVAALLGLLAIFAGSPYTADADRLARDAARGAPRIRAPELAAAIRAQERVRVIDIRDSTAFAEYHIPTAANVPIEKLSDPDFPMHDRIVVYGDDAAGAMAAWLVLRTAGVRDVAIVEGDLDGWLFDVMEPWLPADATADEIAAFEETAALARYFGGRVRRNVEPELVAERRSQVEVSGHGAERAEALRRARRACAVR